MVNKMRDERNKLKEIKGAGVACTNTKWLYPQVMGQFSENCIVDLWVFFFSADWKSAVYRNANQ